MALMLLVGSLMLASLACLGPVPATPTAAPPPAAQPTPVAEGGEQGGGSVGNTTAELARAAVKVFALLEEGGSLYEVWVGSGSIISPDGLILTNGHVVDDRFGEYTHLGVGLTDRSDAPPELLYLAQIAAVDYGLDLAVIRIVSDLDGNPVSLNLPYVTVGNSDAIEIGDGLRILGYPVIGGSTITFTEGVLSGFTSERGVPGRAWIKTDAQISGGNSGGMGVNTVGELIGVPTLAASGAETDRIVDCRPVADTNRDGRVDENDTCVPIGGFINGLRPVNLALPLIEAAQAGRQYAEGDQPLATPAGGFNLAESSFYGLQFANGVTADDRPTQLVQSLPPGATDLCAFWDYEGMSDGMSWSAYWFVNGELSESGSLVDQMWDGGSSGNWWVCTYNDGGLMEGLYELVLEVEAESFATGAIFVGGDRSPSALILENQSSATLCYVRISPSQAQNWGGDKLGAEEVIPSGATRSFQLVRGGYDLQILNCDVEVLLEEYGLEISGEFRYTITD
jgi:S1-C subfamily serine protease